MGHYDTPTHTCDDDEHDWEKRATNAEFDVIFVSGKPCLEITWSEEEHCTNTGQAHSRGIGQHTKKCEAKRGFAERDSTIVPIAALEQWSKE